MKLKVGFSAFFCMTSQVIVKNNSGTILCETFEQGIWFNRGSERNTYYYSTAPLRHILNQGDRIFVNTRYHFLTPYSLSISGAVAKGKFFNTCKLINKYY